MWNNSIQCIKSYIINYLSIKVSYKISLIFLAVLQNIIDKFGSPRTTQLCFSIIMQKLLFEDAHKPNFLLIMRHILSQFKFCHFFHFRCVVLCSQLVTAFFVERIVEILLKWTFCSFNLPVCQWLQLAQNLPISIP